MEFKLKVWFEVDTSEKTDDECDELYHMTKSVIEDLEKMIGEVLREKLPITDYYLDTM